MPPEPPLIPALTVHGGWAELIALDVHRSWRRFTETATS
jgi:hypothetical protein